jgi:dipeptidyl aminopeptidase/acylaminoacyl peptidase
VVVVHGGSWSGGDSHQLPDLNTYLAKAGYNVASINYRLAPKYKYPAPIEDVHAAREFMLQSYPEIDSGRVGMLGWSHGGLIALLTVMKHPRAYRVCYAGVPVSDLETRLKTHGKDYEQLFAAPYHLGKTFSEAPEEYHRRSPARNAKKLETPLLVDANTNDEDVKIVEVEKLLQELKTEKKAFQYRIYTNAPGGHYFNRLDTPAARASREEIWKFLAGYLHPPKSR